jgi:hypothetical protein
MVTYGVVNSGTSASSAFTLRANARCLVIGVNSAAPVNWYAAFPAVQGGGFLRYTDPWASNSGAFFAGTAGWGLVAYPSDVVRIETSAALTATTSFAIVEVTR